eukprot:GHVT01038399.1.p1 GENE.GHVT01038399.1~~GHVT01038399.1.p1  ORF type:complete len:215 (-),score=14.43 GHVT01038399.1:870-1514(-)
MDADHPWGFPKFLGPTGVGAALAVLVVTIGDISGCHVNPAVSLAAALTRKIPFSSLAVYAVAQLIGGILGAFFALGIHGEVYFAIAPHSMNSLQQVFLEMFCTALFVLVVLRAGSGEFTTLTTAIAAGLGLYVACEMGGCVNPALPFASLFTILAKYQTLNSATVTGLFIYTFTPLAGAIVAAGTHILIHSDKVEHSIDCEAGIGRCADCCGRR